MCYFEGLFGEEVVKRRPLGENIDLKAILSKRSNFLYLHEKSLVHWIFLLDIRKDLYSESIVGIILEMW